MRWAQTISTCALTILGVINSAKAADTNDPFCESQCSSCCNVNNETSFEFLNIISLEYPDTSLTGKYTILDPGTHFVGGTEYEGTVYQEVIRYENTVNQLFDNNVRIFSVDTQANLTCDQSHFYFDGQQFALEKVESGTLDYCRITGINGVLNRSKLEDYTTTSGVYFAFNKLVEERTEYRIMFDISNRIVPRDDILDYQFFINTTTLTTDGQNDEYFIHIDVLVSDINDMDVDGDCLALDDVMNMSKGHVYIDGSDKCQLEYHEAPSGDANNGGRLYRYVLPQSRYEECAESFTNDGSNIIFTTRLYTPEQQGECFYFQPGFSEQELTITIDAQITTDITEQFEQFTAELVDVEIERCTPIEDYIIPQATKIFTFKTTFVGDTDEVDWVYGALPYVTGETGETNYLYGYGEAYGPGNNGQWKNCTELLTDNQGNPYRECTFKMKTVNCEKIYVTDSNQCGFERNNTRYIYNLEFREEYSGGLFITHRTPRIDTNLEFMLFPESECIVTGEREPINVNDEFPTSMIVRNYWQNVDVDWTNTSEVNFADRVAVRLAVGEEAGTVLNDLSLMLKTILVTLRDPTNNDAVLAQYSFNVAEKRQFMDITWSLYHTDPVFCSWYDSADTNGDYCQPFYSPSQGRNPFIYTQADTDHACKREGLDALESNSRNRDYWVFDPKTWFVDLYSRPYLKVSFTVNAVIHECGTTGSDLPGSDRRRLGSSRELQANTVRYVSDELTVIFGEGPDGEDETTVVREEPANTVVTDLMPTIIAVSVSGGTLLLLVILVICYRSRKVTYNHVEKHSHTLY